MLTNRSMPRATVIPELPYGDVGGAIEWLCAAFGFTLRIRMGNHRAQLNVGNDGAIVLTERAAGDLCRHSVMVRVTDIDEHYKRALAHGAKIERPPTDYPYGERQYNTSDLAGHHWAFSQSIADVDPADWGGESGQL